MQEFNIGRVRTNHRYEVVRSLVPRPFPPPVFDRLQYANTGGGNGLGTRLGGTNALK